MFSASEYINGDAKERFNKPSLGNANEAAKQRVTPRQADDIATRIQDRLKPTTNSWEFYCRVAYTLDQETIDRLLTTAIEKGRNHAALFGYLASKEMGLK